MSEELLRIENIETRFRNGKSGIATVLDGVSISIKKGEIIGLVGESGSGKSITMLSALQLLPGNGFVAGGNVVLAGEFCTLWGEDEVEVELCSLRFRLSPRSFFQVNLAQAAKLYALAVEFAGLTGNELAVDLYCGAGAIGLLAAAKAREVVGVEVVAAAVEDAKETALRNGVSNIRFLCADAAEAAARFAAEGLRPDVLFVDPPRKGLDPRVIGSVAAMAPARVVYVSCDPGTLARDLKLFARLGYTAEKAVAVDMFPRTRHVETVCCLYHQKKDFISVPYEPKNADYLQQLK